MSLCINKSWIFWK